MHYELTVYLFYKVVRNYNRQLHLTQRRSSMCPSEAVRPHVTIKNVKADSGKSHGGASRPLGSHGQGVNVRMRQRERKREKERVESLPLQKVRVFTFGR